MVPAGGRMSANASARAMASTYRDQILELVQPTDLTRWWCSLMAGVGQCDRTCMRLFAEVLRIIEPEKDLVLVYVQQLGINDPQQLASIVSRFREAEGMDEEALAERSERFLTDYYRSRGKRFVVLDAAQEVANGNGR